MIQSTHSRLAPGPLAPINPLECLMNLPSFDRFPYTLKDLDPADPDWAEQVEEEKGERDMDFERNEPK
jgi:hypothetical protein